MDMLTLVNALLHFDEAEYLYNLATSNFFNLDLPKAALYEYRKDIKDSWKAKGAEKVTELDLVNYIIDYLNASLARIDGRDGKWEYVVRWLRTKPVLQALRDLYDYLQPWKNFNPDNAEAQRYYQINVDLIFEHLINTCNIDKLTVNTLQEHLYSNIASHVSVDSRSPEEDKNSQFIQCITVHKSKGLEYGHVILPYCSFPIDKIKKTMLHVSAEKHNGHFQIGYRIDQGDIGTFQNSHFNMSAEVEERSREETRVLYVAMTRAIRSFSWIEISNNSTLNWQNLIEKEEQGNAL
jgi:ATP-dependent exoDNAse (exonuclease V) beta subunit